jgi:zinc and cadmium transporter
MNTATLAMFKAVWPVLGLTFLLTVVVGLIPILRDWKQNHLHHFVSFSAGVLIATAFLHILPEAVHNSLSGEWMGVGILAGFLFLFVLEKFIMIHPCEETHCDYHNIGIAAFVGIGLHSVFDGIAMGTSFFSPALVNVLFFAIIVHKMPSSFALASLLKAAQWRPRKILIAIVLFSLIIPVSAVLSVMLLFKLPAAIESFTLNFALGSFLYIATSDFLPEIHRRHAQKAKNLLAFLLGVTVMGLLALKHGH